MEGIRKGLILRFDDLKSSRRTSRVRCFYRADSTFLRIRESSRKKRRERGNGALIGGPAGKEEEGSVSRKVGKRA